mgnify:CR=1 FL=1
METHNVQIKSNTDLFIVFFYEMLGTFILTMGINFSNYSAAVMAAGSFIAIVATYRITGAHLNKGYDGYG